MGQVPQRLIQQTLQTPDRPSALKCQRKGLPGSRDYAHGRVSQAHASAWPHRQWWWAALPGSNTRNQSLRNQHVCVIQLMDPQKKSHYVYGIDFHSLTLCMSGKNQP